MQFPRSSIKDCSNGSYFGLFFLKKLPLSRRIVSGIFRKRADTVVSKGFLSGIPQAEISTIPGSKDFFISVSYRSCSRRSCFRNFSIRSIFEDCSRRSYPRDSVEDLLNIFQGLVISGSFPRISPVIRSPMQDSSHSSREDSSKAKQG